MVYASEHQSLAAFEARVHIEKTSMRLPYKCFAFRFDESLMIEFPIGSLPHNWRQEPAPASLQLHGDAWIESGESVILSVPSVIIPDERNYLINPKHPLFKRIKIDEPSDFTFDQRLFK